MISILNKRSSTHSNWCEDNYWLYDTDEFVIGAVLDGCSTGINSHFASTLVKYSFEKSSKSENLNNDPDILVDAFLCELRSHFKSIRDEIGLTEMNLLSTIVFFHYSKIENKLFVKFIGDGVIYVNGNEFVNDENNTPDYLSYHLNESWSHFYKWLDSKRIEIYENVENFAICSDGIHSLVNLKNPHIKKEVAINYLIVNEDWRGQFNGLNKKFNILTNKDDSIKKSEELFWWDIKDDLTVIRYATI